MELTIFQVDAFASSIFRGNPAAVIPLDDWLPDEQLQAIALENNLSETAYFKKGVNGYDLRWFTPAIEVDLCGHATLASAHVLFEHLKYTGEKILFNCRSGVLSVGKSMDSYLMNFPADKLEKVENPPKVLAKALGVTPEEVFKGREDYLVIVDSQETVANLKPDFRALSELGGRGTLVSAPGKEVDFVSRCFFPNAGIDEDPVTGSAHTTMIPYWAKRLGKNELQAKQISARSGEVQCHLKNDRVELGGNAVTYMIGKVFL